MPCARRWATSASTSTAAPTARASRSTTRGASRERTRALILDGVVPPTRVLGPYHAAGCRTHAAAHLRPLPRGRAVRAAVRRSRRGLRGTARAARDGARARRARRPAQRQAPGTGFLRAGAGRRAAAVGLQRRTGCAAAAGAAAGQPREPVHAAGGAVPDDGGLLRCRALLWHAQQRGVRRGRAAVRPRAASIATGSRPPSSAPRRSMRCAPCARSGRAARSTRTCMRRWRATAPALLLSGTADPVTPAQFGEEAASGLPRRRCT